MKQTFRYGSQNLDFDIPEKASELRISDPEFSINKDEFLRKLNLKLPPESSKYKNVAIVVSDKTRLCGYPLYLPWLITALESRGCKKENITFYIAYGTHPKQTEEESLSSYGEVYQSSHFVHHDCYDEAALVQLGVTQRGTPVKLRRDVIESSLIITFGAISHHYFAGFGGGRKLLFPGLADRKSIYKNHSLYLDREAKKLAVGCQPGNLDGNPLADDLKEIDSYMPPKVSVHGILNSKGEVVDLIPGNCWDDFLSACAVHDSFYRSDIQSQFDMVIASSGGYPKDINFIQAHKSIHHSAAFVKDGGTLVILSECRDGIASNYFLQYLEAGGFDRAYAKLEENYEGNGGTALSMMAKTNRISVYMVTSLAQDMCNTLNVKKITTEDVQGILDKERGSVAFVKNASLLVK